MIPISVKNNNKIIGNYYEKLAIKYLIKNEYNIIVTNYRYESIDGYRPLELDIIATKDEVIFFFEVKYRQKNIHGYFPCGQKKIDNITQCSENFLYHNPQYKHLWPKINCILITPNTLEILDVN
jgi:Holliday junction resolvase-like predicted endonuclease